MEYECFRHNLNCCPKCLLLELLSSVGISSGLKHGCVSLLTHPRALFQELRSVWGWALCALSGCPQLVTKMNCISPSVPLPFGFHDFTVQVLTLAVLKWVNAPITALVGSIIHYLVPSLYCLTSSLPWSSLKSPLSQSPSTWVLYQDLQPNQAGKAKGDMNIKKKNHIWCNLPLNSEHQQQGWKSHIATLKALNYNGVIGKKNDPLKIPFWQGWEIFEGEKCPDCHEKCLLRNRKQMLCNPYQWGWESRGLWRFQACALFAGSIV